MEKILSSFDFYVVYELVEIIGSKEREEVKSLNVECFAETIGILCDEGSDEMDYFLADCSEDKIKEFFDKSDTLHLLSITDYPMSVNCGKTYTDTYINPNASLTVEVLR